MRTAIAVIVALALWLPGIGISSARAGPCDAHFTFDDTLADASGNGYDGLMFGASCDMASPQGRRYRQPRGGFGTEARY